MMPSGSKASDSTMRIFRLVDSRANARSMDEGCDMDSDGAAAGTPVS